MRLLKLLDRRTPEQKEIDAHRKAGGDYRANMFRRTLSHSIFPRFDEVNKKWFTIKRNY